MVNDKMYSVLEGLELVIELIKVYEAHALNLVQLLYCFIVRKKYVLQQELLINAKSL